MIAVDVMGGDNAPQAIIRGALLAAKKTPVTLFGPQKIIITELNKLDNHWKTSSISICDASEHISMDENPVSSVKKKRNSSMIKAVKSLQNGSCKGVVSAGNTGAFMVATKFILGCLPGIERPAIASWLLTSGKPVIGLDLGANTECRAKHLLQFAKMGTDYAKKSLRIQNPRVGLLSNGHEKGKGSQLTKEAFKLIENSTLNFTGNVEPIDIFMNKIDVLVCDGFSGNVMLKTMEASYSMIMELISSKLTSFAESLREQIIQNIKAKIFNNNSGGAPLLGINGTAIVCHGKANFHEIQRAILLAQETVTNPLFEQSV